MKQVRQLVSNRSTKWKCSNFILKNIVQKK